MASACSLCPTECTTCIGPSSCTNCRPGYAFVSGACNQCPYYQYSNGGVGNCVNCVAGWVQSPAGNSCVNCPSSCATCTSVTNCLTCLSGSGFNSGACTQCTNGYYSPGGISACIYCGDGMYSPTGAPAFINCNYCDPLCLSCTGPVNGNCLTCIPGYYVSVGSCSVCSAGYFTPGTVACQPCPNGTYALSPPSSCNNCPTQCSSCTNSTLCTYCLSGHYLTLTYQCRPCSANTYSSGGTTNTCTPCPAATFSLPVASSCDPCSFGCAVCNNNLTCQTCLSNFKLNTTNSQCVSCSLAAAPSYSVSKLLFCFENGTFCFPAISNCHVCYNSTLCLYCDPPYLLYQSECIDCSFAYVRSVSNLSYTMICYGVNSSCFPQIPSCIACYNSSLCLHCDVNHILENNTCIECDLP